MTFYWRCVFLAFSLAAGGLLFVPSVAGQEASNSSGERQQLSDGAASESLPTRTALDRYVHKPDDTYQWTIENVSRAGTTTTIVAEMTSQTWLTPREVDRPRWQHWVTLVIPDEVKSDVGFLMISGGSNDDEPPTTASKEITEIAKATGTVVAELEMVPNQPLIFHGDGIARKEDDLIAYTWDQFLKTGDSRWLARNAMVKSAVGAMDAITEIAKEKRGHDVNRFVVAGASKRGWTTWLTGAVDDRVAAIIPIVIDVLNSDASLRHHFAAYGYWAPSLADYAQHHIMPRLDQPQMDELLQLVDPYFYRHRLKMPKLVLNAAGDQFFLPDSSRFYFSQLQGEKHLRYVPNTDHGMGGSDSLDTVLAFYALIASGRERPRFSWHEMEDGGIRVVPVDKPKEVRLYSATNPGARDFRLETLGPAYTSKRLSPRRDGAYVARVEKPAEGWTAYFVELTYDVGLAVPLKLTTGVTVTPDNLPFADRDATQAISITVKCDTQSESMAEQLLSDSRRFLRSTYSSADIRTQAVGKTVYLNWSPSEMEKEAEAIIQWLRREGGGGKINVQLESGRHITKTP